MDTFSVPSVAATRVAVVATLSSSSISTTSESVALMSKSEKYSKFNSSVVSAILLLNRFRYINAF